MSRTDAEKMVLAKNASVAPDHNQSNQFKAQRGSPQKSRLSANISRHL